MSGPHGSVAALWRYPVKSLQGEPVERVTVTRRGVAGDRRYALRDPVTQRLLTAKRDERLLRASARTLEGGPVVVAVPGAGELSVDDPALAAALAGWLDRDVEVVRAGDGGRGRVEMDLDAEMLARFAGALRPDPDDPAGTMLFETPRESFADTREIHLLTEATLRGAAAAYGEGAGDVRRFRPNIVVAGGGGPFGEDAWVGSDVTIGAAAGAITRPVLRCVVITRPQPSLDAEPQLLRRLHADRRAELGVFFVPTAPAEIRIGDPLRAA